MVLVAVVLSRGRLKNKRCKPLPHKKTVKAEFPGGPRDAIEVAIEESLERWTEITLEDGSILRVKPVVLTVLRATDEYDKEGNPLYSVKLNPVMTVSAPEELKKGGTKPSTEIH